MTRLVLGLLVGITVGIVNHMNSQRIKREYNKRMVNSIVKGMEKLK